MHCVKLKNSPFGARIDDINCARLDGGTVDHIRAALVQHQLLVIPGQVHLTPAEEVGFVRKIDIESAGVWRDQKKNPWERFKVEQGNKAGTYQIPFEPGVLVLGQGEIDHHGLNVTLGGDRAAYGEDSGSQVLGGGSLQWHIDGAFYGVEPCNFTQMRCIEAPAGPGHWLYYDDAADDRLWCESGSTAFVSGQTALQQLDADSRGLAARMQVHYLPRPFQTTYRLKNSQNGLRVIDLESERRFELGVESPGVPSDDPDARIYPLVWTCPETGKAALMPHPRCIDHLEDTELRKHMTKTESRLLVEKMMRPGIAPDLVYVHAWNPGDLVIWNNRTMWHSATGELGTEDRRVQHLTAFNGLAPPC